MFTLNIKGEEMNYDRYRKVTEQKYNKKKISTYLMRKPSDRILIPFASHICGKKVLEVGIGFGYYTKYYMNNENTVKAVDINPQLGSHIGIDIVPGSADQLQNLFKETFDCIVSFFMTEYISYQEMKEFIQQSLKLLNKGGKFATTIILKKGIGRLYIILARLKGIKKYNYSMEEIKSMVPDCQNMDVHITALNGILNIPYAVLLEIEKE